MSVRTTITVDNRQLQQGMQQAEQIVNQSGRRMQQGVNGATNGMTKFGQAAQAATQAATGGLNGVAAALSKIGPIGVVAGAALLGIGVAAKSAWNFLAGTAGKLDAIGKAAKSVNISSDAYLGIAYASKSAGIEAQKVLNIITRLDQAIAHSAEGNQKYIDAFAELGIYWRDLENATPEQKFIKLVEQVRKFKEEGKTLPSGLQDLVGRRDIQTINKAEADSFDKKFYSAAMEGFGITPEAIAAGENFTSALGALDQRFLATIVQIKAFDEALKWVTDSMNGMFSGNKTDLPGTMRGAFVSYGEAASKSIDKLDTAQLKELAKIMLPTTSDTHARMAAEEKIDEISGQGIFELRDKLKEMLKDAEARAKLDDTQARRLYEFVKRYAGKTSNLPFQDDVIFDPEFANQKYVSRSKKKATTTEQDIAETKVKGQYDLLEQAIDDENKKALKIIESSKSRLSIEQRINDLLKERQRLLPRETQEQREQLRLELQLKALETQRNKEKALIASLQESSEKVQAAAFGNIFATLGFDKSMMDSLLAGYSSTTGKGPMEVMDSLIRQELYNRVLKGGDWNGQKIPEIENTTFSGLLQNNPGLFTDIMKSIGGKMSAGRLDYMITTDAINSIQDNLNAVNNELEPFAKGLAAAGITEKQIENAGFNPFNATNENQKFTMENIDKMLDFYKGYVERINSLEAKQKSNVELTAAEKTELTFGKEKLPIGPNSSLMSYLEVAAKNINKLSAVRSLLVPAQALAEWNKQNAEANKMTQGERIAKSGAQLESLRIEYELRQAILSGDEKEIRLLEKKQMLLKMGLPVNEDTLKANDAMLESLLNQQEHLKNQSVLLEQRNKLEDMGYSLMEKQGRGREAAALRALDAAKRNNGGKDLSHEATMAVTKAAELEWQISNFQFMSRTEDKIHANELAQRGGFNSSVVVERNDNGKAILDQMKQLLKLEETRNTLLNNVNSNLKRPG